MKSRTLDAPSTNRAVLVEQVRGALARGEARRLALQTPAEVSAWQLQFQSSLRRASAPLPPADRGAPDTVAGSVLSREGYTITPLLIESRDEHHIPAHLYLPSDLAGPVPGVLIACGHAAEGKAYPWYQQAGALCARHGMAALVFDPLDQGERCQDPRDDGSARTWGTHSHNLSGAKALLLGWSQTGLEAWDSMRALDALAARPEVDGERLGVMGNSGGGTQSAQLFALDDRVRVAAPSCYLTSHGLLAGGIGPQDAEQWQPGMLAQGFDHADYLGVRAPAPALICAVLRDFFPIEGTRAAFAAARGVYEQLGAGSKVALETVDESHGWHPRLQQASVRWMARHLRGEEVQPAWSDEVPMSPEEARVVGGRVLAREGERSIHEVLREECVHLAEARGALPHADRLAAARELAGVRVHGQRPGAQFSSENEPQAGGVEIGWVTLADGMVLPAARREREGAPRRLFFGAGAHSADHVRLAGESDAFFVDPLAFADAAPKEGGWYGAFGTSARDAAWLYQLGETLVGRHAEQLLACAELHGGRPAVHATGLAQVGAAHALALEPERFEVESSEVDPGTWSALFQTTAIEGWFAFVVPGALGAYDLDDLRRG